jgi:hypothetical protein
MRFHVEPASVEYSNFTDDTPVDDQVIDWVVPMDHLSPPLGEIKVIAAPAVMVKGASLTSLNEPEELLTITRAFVVGAFGTVHWYVPLDAETLETTVVHDVPSLVEYLIRTLFKPDAIHVIA